MNLPHDPRKVARVLGDAADTVDADTVRTDGVSVGSVDGVSGFDKTQHGLRPVRVDTWESFVFVCLDRAGESLSAYLGNLVPRVARLDLTALRFVERRTYELRCNWKVFIDNYLDGGYHVPHIHKGLGSVLNYKKYEIACHDR